MAVIRIEMNCKTNAASWQDDIEWPDPEDFEVQVEAKEIITLLLQQHPSHR